MLEYSDYKYCYELTLNKINMEREDIKLITERVDAADASNFISLLEKMGVGGGLIFYHHLLLLYFLFFGVPLVYSPHQILHVFWHGYLHYL